MLEKPHQTAVYVILLRRAVHVRSQTPPPSRGQAPTHRAQPDKEDNQLQKRLPSCLR
jgi:hypothetical protein